MVLKRKNPAAVALGRLGGLVRSAAKAAAVRENGKKGGRPRKPVVLVRIHNGQFLAEYRRRDRHAPVVLRETKKHVWIAQNDPALRELVTEAKQYQGPVAILTSARALVQALADAGVT